MRFFKKLSFPFSQNYSVFSPIFFFPSMPYKNVPWLSPIACTFSDSIPSYFTQDHHYHSSLFNLFSTICQCQSSDKYIFLPNIHWSEYNTNSLFLSANHYWQIIIIIQSLSSPSNHHFVTVYLSTLSITILSLPLSCNRCSYISTLIS